MKVLYIGLIGLLLLSSGCVRHDEGRLYRTARAYVQAQVGEGVEVAPRSEAQFAVGKNAARVDLDYRLKGDTSIEGYMTVWYKRIRLRWEFDRAIDHRTSTKGE